jgi:hypothetical protein
MLEEAKAPWAVVPLMMMMMMRCYLSIKELGCGFKFEYPLCLMEYET